MKLPNAHLAVVDQRKIAEYLLNPSHPDNGGKAPFFAAMGFTVGAWNVLAEALRGLARTADVSATSQSPHGQKFVVDGEMDTPVGKRPRMRSVWIIDQGSANPRLVTAYPHA